MVKTIKEIEERSRNSYVSNVIKESYRVKKDATKNIVNIAFIVSYVILPIIFIITALIVF